MSPNDGINACDDDLALPVLHMLRRSLPGHHLDLTRGQKLVVRHKPDAPVLLRKDISAALAEIFEAQCHARRAEALMTRLADEICAEVAPSPLLPNEPFPILRPASFVAAYGDDALHRGGVGDCKAVLMRQRAGGPPQVLTHADAAQAGLTPETLWAAAHRNLRAQSGSLILQKYDYGVMSIEVEGHDWLGGSLLLSQTVLTRALERLDIHRALVCAPSRISVDLVDLDAPDALARIETWMAERLAEDRPLSELVFSFERDWGRLIPAYASRGGRLIGPV